MRIVVSGGTGFLGGPLVQRLLERGDDVAVLTRNPAKVQAGRALPWDARHQDAWSDQVALADAIVNLAGENIGEGRWTPERKRTLIDSRLEATHAIVTAIRSEPNRRRVLVNASAVGFYGDRGEDLLDESAMRGAGFLAELVQQWETCAKRAEPEARVVILRVGVVLGPGGGAVQKMLLPFKLGVGGPMGDGQQWMSWVSREDVLRMIEWAIDNGSARGVYNASAPAPVRNRDFARALGQTLHRPSFFPAPAFALRLAVGEMADEALLASQRVVPRRAEEDGFEFRARTIDEALSFLK